MSVFKPKPWLAKQQQQNAMDVMDRLRNTNNILVMPVHADPLQHPKWATAQFAAVEGLDDLVFRLKGVGGQIEWYDLWCKAVSPTLVTSIGSVHDLYKGQHWSLSDPVECSPGLHTEVGDFLAVTRIKVMPMPRSRVYPVLDPLEVVILYCDRSVGGSVGQCRFPLLTVCHRNVLAYFSIWPQTQAGLSLFMQWGLDKYWPTHQIPATAGRTSTIVYHAPLTQHPSIVALSGFTDKLTMGRVPAVSLATDRVTDPLYTLDKQPPGSVTPQLLEQWVMTALADPVCQQNQKVIGF